MDQNTTRSLDVYSQWVTLTFDLAFR